MNKFVKLISSVFFLFIIFILLLVILFSNKSYSDYHYSTPNDFMNSESFSWYINIFPESSRDIFLRTFIETNEAIIIFRSNRVDELPSSKLYTITSINKGEDILRDLNIPSSQIQYFLEKGKLYCYFYQKDSPYLVGRYYSNDDVVHYIFITLQPQDALAICQ